MLSALLAKDLRRARRNPLPWLINIAIPVCITALIGMAFGGKSENGALGRIRFAVVDEDQSALGRILQGAGSSSRGGQYLEPVFMDRTNALKEINSDKMSAVLIIPTNFTSHYLDGDEPVSLELIKNPAESVHPTVIEEMTGAAVTGLNGLARNFQQDFPEFKATFSGDADYHRVSELIEREGEKLGAMKQYINPPLVEYDKETPENDKKTAGAKPAPPFNLFGYMLIGMTAMFSLFLANIGMGDLHREIRNRTFERYHTLNQSLVPFLAGKILFTVVMLVLGSAVMLGGGSLLFNFHWLHPLEISALALAYACFAASFLAVVVSLVGDERRSNMVANMTAILLGMAGGCMFPAEQLPAFIRENLTPLLPSFWFSNTAREIEFSGDAVAWGFTALRLLAAGAVLTGLAAILFKRRFKAGFKA